MRINELDAPLQKRVIENFPVAPKHDGLLYLLLGLIGISIVATIVLFL